MGKTETFVIRKYEKVWYILSLVIPLSIGVTTVAYDGYNPETYTRLCMFDGREFGILSHGPTIGYVWVFAIFVSSVVGFRSTYQVYKKVRDASIAMRRYEFNSSTRSNSEQKQAQQQRQRQQQLQQQQQLFKNKISSTNNDAEQQFSASSQFIQEHPRPRQLLASTEASKSSSLRIQQKQQQRIQQLLVGSAYVSSSRMLQNQRQQLPQQEYEVQENQNHERPTFKLSSAAGSSSRIPSFLNDGSGGNTTAATATAGGTTTTATTATASKRPFGVGGFHSLVRPAGMSRQSSLMSTNTNRTTGSSNTTNSNSSSLKKVRAVATQAVLYSLAYLNSVSWPILVSIFAGIFSKTAGEMYALDVISSTLYPLQGFLNFFVFIRPTYIQWRRNFPHKSRFWAFKQIIEFHAASSSSAMSSADAAAAAARSQRRRRRHRNAAMTQEQNIDGDENNISCSRSNIDSTALVGDADNSTDSFRRSSRLLSVEMTKHPPNTIEEVDDEHLMRDSGDDDEDEIDDNNEDIASQLTHNQPNGDDLESSDGMTGDTVVMSIDSGSPLDKPRTRSQSVMHVLKSDNIRATAETKTRHISLGNIPEIYVDDGGKMHRETDSYEGIKPTNKPKRSSFFGFSNLHDRNKETKSQRRRSIFNLGSSSGISSRRIGRQSYRSSSNLDPSCTSAIDDNDIQSKQRRSSLQSFSQRTPRGQRSSRRKTISDTTSTPSIGSRNISLSAFYDLDLGLGEHGLQDDIEEEDDSENDSYSSDVDEDLHNTEDSSRRALEVSPPSSSQRTLSISAFYDLDLMNTMLDKKVDHNGLSNLGLQNHVNGREHNNTQTVRHPMLQSNNGSHHASWSSPDAFSPSTLKAKKQRQLRRSGGSQRDNRSRLNLLGAARSTSNSSFFTSLNRMGWSSFWRTSSREGLEPEQEDGDFDASEVPHNHDPDSITMVENKLVAAGNKRAMQALAEAPHEDSGRPVATGLRFLQNETAFHDEKDNIKLESKRSRSVKWDDDHNFNEDPALQDQTHATKPFEGNNKADVNSYDKTSMDFEFSSSSTVDA